jgi:hypothetical protein
MSEMGDGLVAVRRFGEMMGLLAVRVEDGGNERWWRGV